MTSTHHCPLNNINFLKPLLSKELHHLLKEIENHVAKASACRHPSFKDVRLIGGTTPLILACQFGDFDTVKHVIEKWRVSVQASATYFSDPAIYNRSKFRIGKASPLFVASFHGHSRIVQYLLERGADVSVKIPPNKFGHFGPCYEWTPLHGAVSDKQFDSRRSLPEQNEERKVIVRTLLEFGANPNIESYNSFNGQPIWTEVMFGPEMITALIHHGLDLKQRIPQTGETLLHHVITRFTEEDALALVILLVEKGADLMARDKKGFTTLLTAANTSKMKILNHLLEREDHHGLDLKQRIPQTSETLLHHVITRFSFTEEDALALVILLVEKGADLKARNKEGFTPLLIAANTSKLKILNHLLERHEYSRTEITEALELASATIILRVPDDSLFRKAFEYRRRAHQLREMEKEASGPSAEKKLGRKIGSNKEWTTLAGLDQLERNPEEYTIQAVLDKLRILSGSINGNGPLSLSDWYTSQSSHILTRSTYSLDEECRMKQKYSQIVDIILGMFDVIIRRSDPLSTSTGIVVWWKLFEDVDKFVNGLIGLSTFPYYTTPGLSHSDYYREILQISMDLILMAVRASTPVTGAYGGISISKQCIVTMFLKSIYPLLNRIYSHVNLPQLLRQPERQLGPNELGKFFFAANPSFYCIKHSPNSYKFFINLAFVRFLLAAGADPNTTNVTYEENTLLHFVAAMSDRKLGDAAGRLLVGYGAKVNQPNKDGKTALDIWIEKNETEANRNEELGGWSPRPEWCCTVPTLLNLAAKVIRIRKIPYLDAPVILHSVVELRD